MEEDEVKDDDSAGDDEEAEEESRTAVGKKSPKEPTRNREKTMRTPTCPTGAGVRIA